MTVVDEAIAASSVVELLTLELLVWGEADEETGELRVIPPGQLDMVESARRRRLMQFAQTEEGGPDWWGDLYSIVGYAFAPLERATWRLATGRSVSTAEGAQLDGVGSAVDLDRFGLPDKLYRAAIRVTGAGLFGGGTREDLNTAARGLWGDRYHGVTEYWPAKQMLSVSDVSAAEAALASSVLDEIRAAGVGTFVEHWPAWVFGVDYLDGEVAPVGMAGYGASEATNFVAMAFLTASNGGGFTTQASNLTPNDIPLLTDPIEVGNQFTVGFSAPYSEIEFEIGEVAKLATLSLAWEYSRGPGVWGALVDLVDGTSAFALAGTRIVSFRVPADWVTVGGTYRVRARVVAYAGPVDQYPLGSWIYVRRFFDGVGDQLGWVSYSRATGA